MKKVISVILVLCMMLQFTGCVFAKEVEAATFTTVKIPFPDTIEDRNSWLTRARYKDSGEVIPLSMSYNGSVYATVPIENADREIEEKICICAVECQYAVSCSKSGCGIY